MWSLKVLSCLTRFKIPNVGVLAFLGMMFMAALAEMMFLLGCSDMIPVSFWLAVFLTAGLAYHRSKKCLVLLLVIYGVGVLLSALGASYSATDAMRAYFPMQRLIAEGWNPIWELNQDLICKYAGTKAVGSFYIEFCPHFTGMIAGIVDRTFGLFSGDLFCGVIMVVALISVAYRFAIEIWHSKLAGMAFSACVAFSPKMTSVVAGHVQYTVYSMMLVAALSAGLWLRNRCRIDLVIAMLALAGAMASKATGVPFAILFAAILIVSSYAEKPFWIIFCLGLLFTFLLCFSPYIVNVMQHASPFPTESLTSDFTGNEDALKMGWVLRLIYAWVSPRLAVFIGRFLYGGDFCPIFNLNVQGYGATFRFILLLGLLLLMLAKRNVVTLICFALFASANLMPVKYIGYSHYCPQLWCVPLMAILNFLYSSKVAECVRINLVGKVFWNSIKSFLCVFVIVLSIMSLIRTFAYYGRCLVLHNVRVHEIQLMKAIVNQWRVLDDPALVKGTVVKLCERYNLRVVDDHKAPLASLNIKYGIVSVSPIPSDRIDALEKRFRIIDSISDFYSFDWTDMLKVLYNALLQLPRKMSLFDGSSVPCVWSDMM